MNNVLAQTCRPVSASCILLLLLASCGFPERRAPHRTIATPDLLISSADMPAGWQSTLGPGPAYSDEVSRDAVMITFMPDAHATSRGATHMVYRYDYLSVAKKLFEDKAILAGATPGNWTDPSIAADDTKFVCYDYEGRAPFPICIWVARYEEYVVYFSAWLHPGRMTVQEMERIIAVIDARMAENWDK